MTQRERRLQAATYGESDPEKYRGGSRVRIVGPNPIYSTPLTRPEQNGRGERMHRELNVETTGPPGYSHRP